MAVKTGKIGRIKIGIYETEIDVYVMNSAEEVSPQVAKILKKHKEKFDDSNDDICDGFAVLIEENPLRGYLVYCTEALTVNVITHETDHMRKYILDFKDIEDYEASANLNAYINQEVFRLVRKAGFEITY